MGVNALKTNKQFQLWSGHTQSCGIYSNINYLSDTHSCVYIYNLNCVRAAQRTAPNTVFGQGGGTV